MEQKMQKKKPTGRTRLLKAQIRRQQQIEASKAEHAKADYVKGEFSIEDPKGQNQLIDDTQKSENFNRVAFLGGGSKLSGRKHEQ